MNWQEVCDHPQLRNLSFKIELNEEGKIVMSPLKVGHSLLQGKITRLLFRYLSDGEVFPECAIFTRKGIRVADVVWSSSERLKQIKNEVYCSIAPEICIEVLSNSNTTKEMLEKKQLYFEQGAHEFWICDNNGKMRFFNPKIELLHSELVPEFPSEVEI
jgi:Uma2 family endonuclease